MRATDFQVSNHDKLDHILAKLCEMVVDGQKKKQNLGMFAAAVLDPDNNCVVGINYPLKDGRRVHAERAAIDSYTARFGSIPEGSIILTTCSPCTEPMPERVGESCQDMISASPVHKVYAGYRDPSQQTSSGNKTYHLQITRNKKIQALCRAFADTWLDDEPLNELQFMGSTCTKDCSGHRAGYAWSRARGGRNATSPFSPSFNKGSAIGTAELMKAKRPPTPKPPPAPQAPTI